MNYVQLIFEKITMTMMTTKHLGMLTDFANQWSWLLLRSKFSCYISVRDKIMECMIDTLNVDIFHIKVSTVSQCQLLWFSFLIAIVIHLHTVIPQAIIYSMLQLLMFLSIILLNIYYGFFIYHFASLVRELKQSMIQQHKATWTELFYDLVYVCVVERYRWVTWISQQKS